MLETIIIIKDSLSHELIVYFSLIDMCCVSKKITRWVRQHTNGWSFGVCCFI